MNDYLRTELIATEAGLRELFDLEPDEELDIRIQVCSGEWRREGNIWRCYQHPEWEE